MSQANEPVKPQKMINYLREQIISGQFGANSRLPSLRELMAQFSLSFGTAKRGIDYLCELGLVEKRDRSGLFVRPGSAVAQTGIRNLALVMPYILETARPGIFPTVLLGIQKEAEAARCSLTLNFLRLKDAVPEALEAMSRSRDGMIVMGEYDSVLEQFPLRVPAIGVCMHNSYGGRISVIDLDPFLAAEQAADYLQRQGVADVNVYIDRHRCPAYVHRAEVFANIWTKRGYRMKIETLEEDFIPDRAMLFTTGTLLQEASCRYRDRTGRLPAQDHLVLGLDGKQLIDPDFYPAPVIAVDWQQVGRIALRECLARIEQPGSLPRRIYLPGRLVETPTD